MFLTLLQSRPLKIISSGGIEEEDYLQLKQIGKTKAKVYQKDREDALEALQQIVESEILEVPENIEYYDVVPEEAVDHSEQIKRVVKEISTAKRKLQFKQESLVEDAIQARIRDDEEAILHIIMLQTGVIRPIQTIEDEEAMLQILMAFVSSEVH